MRFPDMRTAGLALAAELEAFRGREDAIVVAIARGGVAVALAVAQHLGLPLDLVLIRRLLTPRGPDDPVCAVNVAGTCYVDEEAAVYLNEEGVRGEGRRPSGEAADFRDMAAARAAALGPFISGALAELAQSGRACRGGRSPRELAGQTILLVDNGVRTGSTARAVVRALRTHSPARVVVAVPVAARESCAAIETFADDFIYLSTPAPFGHVGLWYAQFNRPDDDQIRTMFEESASGPI